MKKRIILDTDILNEMDDQFAIAYLISYIKQSSNYELCAITIAPFDPSKHLKINDKSLAMQLANKEVLKILDMLNFNCPIYIGSNEYIQKNVERKCEAVDKIISLARKGPLTIIGIAAATNIGLALRLAPDIAKNLEVIWLGGNGLDFPSNVEFNLSQDYEAVKTLFESGCNLTVIPSRPVSSSLFLSQEVSEKYILPCGEIGKYLHELVAGFSKNLKGSGRRLWDVACVYEYFNREKNLEAMQKDFFRTPVVYVKKNGVRIDESFKYTFNNSSHTTTFVCHMDTETVIDDLINKIQNLNI